MSIASSLQQQPDGQWYYWCRNRRVLNPGQERAILWHHGAGGETLLFDPAFGQVPLYTLVYAVAEAGYTILSCDFGGAGTWGNAGNQAEITQAVAWLAALGCRTDKVGLWGVSMGFACVARWAADNPTKVAALTGTIPAASTQYVWDNNTDLHTQMDAAWSGDWQASQPVSDPSATAIRSALAAGTYPFRLDYSDDDTVAGAAPSTALVASVGRGVANGLGNYGHTTDGLVNVDPSAYAAVFDAGLW